MLAWLKEQGASLFVLLAQAFSAEKAFSRLGALQAHRTEAKRHGFPLLKKVCGLSRSNPPQRA